tara:strand:- start:331 stop:465 length:135 start_codon:yes stop_codon:yes gene_type:complete
MNLFSSSSLCGNCGIVAKLIVVIEDYKNLLSGKNVLNVDLFVIK